MWREKKKLSSSNKLKYQLESRGSTNTPHLIYGQGIVQSIATTKEKRAAQTHTLSVPVAAPHDAGCRQKMVANNLSGVCDGFREKISWRS